MSSPLAAVVNGDKPVTDKNAKSVAEAALDKLSSMKNQLGKLKDNAETGMSAVIATVETQGAAALASFAEGYGGDAWMKPMGSPIDVRLPAAAASALYGLMEAWDGKGGSHALSVGNGLLASLVASMAVKAGQKVAGREVLALKVYKDSAGKEHKPGDVFVDPANPAELLVVDTNGQAFSVRALADRLGVKVNGALPDNGHRQEREIHFTPPVVDAPPANPAPNRRTRFMDAEPV